MLSAGTTEKSVRMVVLPCISICRTGRGESPQGPQSCSHQPCPACQMASRPHILTSRCLLTSLHYAFPGMMPEVAAVRRCQPAVAGQACNVHVVWILLLQEPPVSPVLKHAPGLGLQAGNELDACAGSWSARVGGLPC